MQGRLKTVLKVASSAVLLAAKIVISHISLEGRARCFTARTINFNGGLALFSAAAGKEIISLQRVPLPRHLFAPAPCGPISLPPSRRKTPQQCLRGLGVPLARPH